MPELFFCSELSRARPERMYGTAPTPESWLLIEYSEPWGPRAIADSLLPAAVKAWIAGMFPQCRVLFIRHDRAPSLKTCFLVRPREHGSESWQFRFDAYEDLLTINLSNPPDGARNNTQLFLVCTHGRKDKCCAKFGFPAFRTLEKRLGTEVWQCSHVGGDRFAANIVWFPYGLYFGHVETNEIEDLADAFLQQRISLRHLRGRTCYPRHVQVGEYFIRLQFEILGVDQLTFVSADELSPTDWRIRFSTEDSTFTADIRREQGAFHDYLTCAASEVRPVTQYVLLRCSTQSERKIVDVSTLNDGTK